MLRYALHLFCICFISTPILYCQAPTIIGQLQLRGHTSITGVKDYAMNYNDEIVICGYETGSIKEVFWQRVAAARFDKDGQLVWYNYGHMGHTIIDASVGKSFDLIVPNNSSYSFACNIGNTHYHYYSNEVKELGELGPRVENFNSAPNERIKSIALLKTNHWMICRESSLAKIVANSGYKSWEKKIVDPKNIILHQADTLTDGIVVCGIKNLSISSKNFYNDSNDIYIYKLDVDGVKIWEKTIEADSKETVTKVMGMTNGDMVILGETTSSMVLSEKNHGKSDLLLQRMDKDGNILWTKVMGGSDEEHSIGMLKDENDGCIILASTTSNDGDVSNNKGKSDIWLININKEGEIVWEKTYGTSGNDSPKKLMKNSNGEIVVFSSAGGTDGDFNIAKEKWGYYWILTFSLPVGVNEEEQDKNFTIKPNPAQDDIVISGLNQKTERITITTLLGESVVEFPTNRMPTVSVPTNNLSNGVYVIRVGNYAEKLIIQR